MSLWEIKQTCTASMPVKSGSEVTLLFADSPATDKLCGPFFDKQPDQMSATVPPLPPPAPLGIFSPTVDAKVMDSRYPADSIRPVSSIIGAGAGAGTGSGQVTQKTKISAAKRNRSPSKLQQVFTKISVRWGGKDTGKITTQPP